MTYPLALRIAVLHDMDYDEFAHSGGHEEFEALLAEYGTLIGVDDKEW